MSPVIEKHSTPEVRALRAWRVAGWVCALALAVFGVVRHVAPVGPAVEFEVTFRDTAGGVRQPLVVTGEQGAADLLFFEFRGEGRGVFFYDSWGRSGVESEEVPVTPGRPLRVRVEMPGLTRINTGRTADVEAGRLRVVCDGRVVADRDVESHPRGERQIYFGWNPVGGGAGAVELAGTIRGADGREWQGRAGIPRSVAGAVGAWLGQQPWQVFCVVAWAWFAWWAAPRAAAGWRRWWQALRAGCVAHRVFITLTAANSLLFAWMVTYGRFDFSEGRGILADFYDYQMASLLQGRLDVPNAGIGGEAFVWQGKLYGYFGVAPALLRFPMIVFDVAFGQWSRALIVVWFAGALTGAYLLLLEATAALGGAGRRPSSAVVALLVAISGVGSVFFFLSARSYVYHEAIMCGAMLVLWGIWCAWRHLRAPEGRWWIASLVLGTLAVHARPTVGLGGLAALGWATAWHVIVAVRAAPAVGVGAWWRAARRPLLIGVLVVAGALTFNAQAYLKFGTFDGAPLALNRGYTAERMAAIDGKNMHLANIPFTLYSYLWFPNLRFEEKFPWIYLGSPAPRRDFPKAKMDLPDSTLAMPYSMPALMLLATAGAAAVAWRRREARLPLALAWLALAGPALILLPAIATAHRYTGDFCPFLIAAAVWPLARLDQWTGAWRGVALGVLAALAIWSSAVSLAFTLHYQREAVWGVPEEVRMEYRRWQDRFSTKWGLDEGLMQRPPAKP